MTGSRVTRREAVLLTLALLALAAIGIWSSSTKPSPPGPIRSSYDATPRGYRAWFELMGREGIRVTRFESRPAFLDSSIDTLVFADVDPIDMLGASFSDVDAAALGDWVRSGGRLVFLGNGPLRQIARTALAPPGKSRRATGKNIVRQPLGRGQIVFVSDAAAFENASLAKDDRARLAFALARPRTAGGIVAFDEAVRGHLVPSHWWNALPQRLVAAILLVVAILAVALIGAAIRLGPPLVPRDERATSSEEYVDALAALYERARAVKRAIDDALQSTRRALARSGRLVPDTALATSYEELQATAATVEPNEGTLVRALALAHLIRKELERHGTG